MALIHEGMHQEHSSIEAEPINRTNLNWCGLCQDWYLPAGYEPKTLTVTVTAEDIRNGRPKSVSCCPNALALQRATGCDKAWIGRMNLSVDGNQNASQKTPSIVDEWIRKFDAGEPVEPISYTVFAR